MADCRPPGYRRGAAGTPYVFDGYKYQAGIPTSVILDHLVSAGKILPTASVCVNSPGPESRGTELRCRPEFAQFLVTELMPWIRRIG